MPVLSCTRQRKHFYFYRPKHERRSTWYQGNWLIVKWQKLCKSYFHCSSSKVETQNLWLYCYLNHIAILPAVVPHSAQYFKILPLVKRWQRIYDLPSGVGGPATPLFCPSSSGTTNRPLHW